jgi:ABC-type transport system substrate-binding protein
MAAVGQASVARYTSVPNTEAGLATGYTTGTYGLFAGSPDYANVDSLLKSALTTMDDTKRTAIVAQVAKIVTDSYTAIQIGSVPSYMALDSEVNPNGLPNPMTNLGKYAYAFKHAK